MQTSPADRYVVGFRHSLGLVSMAVQRMCKDCGKSIIVWSTAQTRCPKCQLGRSKAKPRKPINKRGKHAKLWQGFRDTVAKPYLDKKYGHVCSVKGCMETENLDVDHIKGRGSNPQLRYDVKNMQYLCRSHHIKKTQGKL